MSDFPDGSIILVGLEGGFESFDGKTTFYDYSKCIEYLVETTGMDHIDAVEHMHFNVIGGRSMYPSVYFLGWDDEYGEEE